MTLATMADRSLLLAERVERLVNDGFAVTGAEYADAIARLLATDGAGEVGP